MKKIIIIVFTLFIISMPLISLAHPGHGDPSGGYTIIHYFTEPMHAVFTYGIILSAITYILYSRKRKQSENI
jgi:hypothetical protein